MFASITLAACALLGGCAVGNRPDAVPTCRADERGHVVVVDGADLGCDVVAPQVLVVMDPLTPCEDMGGVIDGDACVNVDY